MLFYKKVSRGLYKITLYKQTYRVSGSGWTKYDVPNRFSGTGNQIPTFESPVGKFNLKNKDTSGVCLINLQKKTIKIKLTAVSTIIVLDTRAWIF